MSWPEACVAVVGILVGGSVIGLFLWLVTRG